MIIENESRSLEWKENTSSNYLKTVSAFANYNDGRIIFGVRDKDGTVIGLDDPAADKLSIENAINDSIKPRPKYSLAIETVDEHNVIVLKVYKGSKPPYMYKNKTFCRSDTSTVSVDEVMYRQLYLEGNNLSFDELEADTEDFSFSCLEQSLKEKLGIESLSRDLEKTLGLYTSTGYTNAAMLLADTNDYRYGIDIVRFGANDNIFVERRELKRISILSQYQQAMDMFDKWYAPYEEVVGFYRESRIHIPREAFREAVANAIIHRDYVLKANIRISMREDGIEITSPGGLPAGMDKTSYVNGLFSRIRNETLAEIFRRLQIIEKFGTGILRIKEAYQEFKQSPVFDVIEGQAINVVLPIVTYPGSKSEADDYVYRVLKYVNDNVEVSKSDILANVGGSDASLKRVLKSLSDTGKILRLGKARNTRYKAIL